MTVRAGTSGFSYKEWKGTFYPEKLANSGMLAFYASQLPTVEINNTFYRMPKPEVLEGWREQVPEDFRFILKASRRITHFKRLKDCGEECAYFIDTARVLGERLGAVLFQLPPNFKKDLDRLNDFLKVVPDDVRAAFEFRHTSWFEDDVFELLRERNRALCLAETEDATPEVVSTADWGYLRLRRAGYSSADLARWRDVVTREKWAESFVFFKHEDEGSGPRMARDFLSI